MESSKLLSGRDLVESVSVKVSDTVLAKGAKHVLPDGSWIEKRQIESALDSYKSLLEQQRIEKHGSLSQAEWIHKLEKALVTERKGPHWLHIGHVEDQKTYIYPEEALHLLEMNSLELKYGGVIMSLQQAYTLLIGKSVSPDEYRVYSLLSKQGFKLIRYNKNRQYFSFENTNDSNEDPETTHGKESVNTIEHPRANGDDKAMSAKLARKEKSDEALPINFLENIDHDNLVTIDKNASMEIAPEEKSVNRTDNVSTFETSDVSGIVEQPSFNDSFQDLLEKEMTCIHGLNNSVATDANVNNDMSPKSCQVNDEPTTESNHKTVSNSLDCNIVSVKDNVNNVNEIEKFEDVKNDGESICQVSAVVTEEVINIDSSEMSVAPLNNDSVDIIDVNRSDIVLEDSNNITSDSNRLHNDSVPGETDVIKTDKRVETNSMCVDSSSDDCMIVNDLESLKKTDVVVKSGQKRTSTQENMLNSCSKFFRKNNCDENSIERTAGNNSNDIDMIELSTQIKLKILGTMVNCHRKNIVYVKAPSREFIPAKINLAQTSYFVDLNKFSSKKDFENEYRPISFSNRVRSNHLTNNISSHLLNNSSHNHQYWNHIFHHVRMQSRNSNTVRGNYLARFRGQISTFNSRDPRRNPNPSPFSQLSHQFSSNQREINPVFNCRNVPSQSSREMARLNQSSPLFFNDNIRNHVNKANMLKQNQTIRRNIENRLNTSSARSNDEEENISQSVALKRIETLLSTYNSLNEEQRSQLKDSLKKTIDLYNKQYKTNFVPNLDVYELNYDASFSNSSKKTSEAPNENVVQLSSDSDTDNRSQYTSRDDSNPRRDVKRVKKRTRLELNQRRQQYSSLCFDVNNSDSSNESDIDNATVLPQSIVNPRKADYDSDQIVTNNKAKNNILPKVMADNIGDENSIKPDDSEFKSWISANFWNKPEVSSKKLRNKRINFTNINLTSAYLRNIRELSFNDKSPVNSWEQAKRVYENENESTIVCVSDDEIVNDENTPEAVINGTTILTDKTVPLIRPDDCKTVETVLKRLQIIKSAGEISDFHETEVLTELKISFDVYAPTLKKLKKTCLPLPSYSIVVLSHSSSLPSPAEFSKLRSNLAENVPYLLAVVSFDAVSFIQMENVDLPILIRRNNNYNMKF